jgi:membrane-bound lytic murein transglycosylase A
MTHMRCICLALILLAAACTTPQTPQPRSASLCPCPPPKPAPETARYEARGFSDLPGWRTAQLEPSLRAFLGGCARLTAAKKACELAKALPPGDEAAARRLFESEFTPYAVVSSESGDSGLITGYYEPIIDGSRSQTALHRHPIFGVPEDLIVVDVAALNPDLAKIPELRNLRLRGRVENRRLLPYYSRGEIDARGSALAAPVIAWSADPVELFFLQIQGSGQVRLENGERLRVGYADQNGHPYRSLGRHLVERGELLLEQASMQGIKAWAAANPAKLQEALSQNPSYVFFRELPTSDGPIGALSVPLHAERSLAVDRRFIPLGAPVYLATTFPLSEQPLERLMAAHDTGGAIRGVVRGDFFWGTGPDAGALAGRMRQQGRLWLLWPTGEPLPSGPASP